MQISRLPGKVLKIAGEVILFPIKILFLPLKLVSLFHDEGIDVSGTNRRTGFSWRNAIGWVLTAPIRLLFFPVTIVMHAVRTQKASELLILFPALLMLGFMVFITYRITLQTSSIERRYLSGARRAIAGRDPQLAKKYFQRVIEKGDLSDQETYNWAVILGMSGEIEQAESFLTKIAPDDDAGYPLAHQAKALQLAEQIKESPDESKLTRLHWHLKNSGKPTPKSDQAWAAYYIANQQPQEAIDYLNRAAESFPELYLALADLCEENSLDGERIQALRKARSRFEELLKENPLDQSSRVALSKSLLELNEPEMAEDTMLSGLRIYATPELRRATSDFYVLRFDRATSDDDEPQVSRKLSASQQFDLLSRSLSIDPEHMPTYLRLVGLSTASSDSERERIKSDFLSIVTSEHSTALAHVCLAHLYWQAENQEEVRWHLGQAWGLDDQFGNVASILAMAFASAETPDSGWAFELANESVKRKPDEDKFRFRLGDVLLNQQKYEEAVQEFNQVLPNSPNPSQVHERLAFAFEKTGDMTQARIHSGKAIAAAKLEANQRVGPAE